MSVNAPNLWTEDIPHSLWKRLRAGHQVSFFLGAGSAASRLQLIGEQLPTGQRMKQELLEYYYFNLAEERLEDRFREEFKTKFNLGPDTDITPEMVWTGLVSESQKKLPEHIALLAKIFEVNKSVPPTYRYVAWLAMNAHVRSVITTNFDEKLDQAIKDAQIQFNLRLLKDSESSWMKRLDDWQYSTFAFTKDHYQELVTSRPRAVPILKLHGTLSHPSSIRAALSSINKLDDDPKFAMHQLIEESEAVVFLGYRANDKNIFDALMDYANGGRKKPEIYWVDVDFSRQDSRQKIIEAFQCDLPGHAIRKEAFWFCREAYLELKSKDEWKGTITREKRFIDASTSYLDEHVRAKDFEDPVYGRISFPADVSRSVVRVLNAADIQRLRDIRQLSFAHYRYPSATHSRFAHSLGVAYLVSQAADTLRRADSERLGTNFVTDVTLAALVHDAGHGPYGHVLDKLANRLKGWKQHEKKTSDIVHQGILDLPDALREANANHLWVAAGADPDSVKDRAVETWWRPLIDGALDFDRVDFLLRDLHCLGFPPEIFKDRVRALEVDTPRGRARLVETLTQSVVRDESVGVAFRDSKQMRDVVEAMFDLYALMYKHVYYATHPVLVMEHMVARALELVILSNEFDSDSFYKYTDSGLTRAIEMSDSGIAKELIWAVNSRRPFVEAHSIPALPLEHTKDEEGKGRSVRREQMIEQALQEAFDLDVAREGIRDVVIAASSPYRSDKPVHLQLKDGTINAIAMGDRISNLNAARRTYVFVAPNSPLRKDSTERERAKSLIEKIEREFA